MLRILLGYRTNALNKEDPTVLYCGHHASELERVAANAPEEFTELQRADVGATRRARRDPALKKAEGGTRNAEEEKPVEHHPLSKRSLFGARKKGADEE
jgi:hypothetical protein